MTVTTTRATTTTRGWCAAESASECLFRLEQVDRAYRSCRRRKRGAREVQRYEMALLDRLVSTTDDLVARRWRPTRSVCFAVSRPKAREIHAAAFSDRVVHHLLVPPLEALFEPVFIHDLYSNRHGKGIHTAVRRLAHFMRRASENGARPAWFLQLDVRNFFNSIDHAILRQLLARRVERGCPDPGDREALLWLAGCIIDGATDTFPGGDPRLLARVPPHKRLDQAGAGRGLPIGNLTSQFFANVYLNELDQFIKHALKARFYLRYVDDLMLVDPDRDRLLAHGDAIERFLAERLALQLKQPWRERPVKDGANFLGYIVRPWYRLVRGRVIAHLAERLDRFERVLVRHSVSVRAEPSNGGKARQPTCPGLPPGMFLIDLPPPEREALRATLASYFGHFSHAHSARLTQRLPRRWPWIGRLFQIAPGPRLLPRWEPRGVASLASQWRVLRRRFHPARVLIQVGCRWELHGDDVAGLPPPLVRAARPIVRSGMPGTGCHRGAGLSFAETAVGRLEAFWQARGEPYALIVEEGRLRGGLKRRLLRRLFFTDAMFSNG